MTHSTCCDRPLARGIGVAILLGIVTATPRAVNGADDLAPLVAQLKAADAAVRVTAVRGLATAADTKAASGALAGALGDAEPRVRFAAALALAAVADRATDDDTSDALAAAVPALVGLLGDGDHHVVRAAATALGAIGPADDDDTVRTVVNALVRVVSATADAQTHAAALTALADYGPAAEAAVPALVRRLRSSAPLVREGAAAALAAIGPEARAATGELARGLADPETLVRAAPRRPRRGQRPHRRSRRPRNARPRHGRAGPGGDRARRCRRDRWARGPLGGGKGRRRDPGHSRCLWRNRTGGPRSGARPRWPACEPRRRDAPGRGQCPG
ncbi:MAG: hypothetical protein EBV05_14325 [Cyanobacteria bacterium WB6_1B_304]|nr:hypothetical protein [Cyanobacteria bacterium WB6_1B_304]